VTRVGLILTGDSERGGMAQALGRGFPGAIFELVPGRHDGFTSGAIAPAFTPDATAHQNVEKLINTLLGAVTDRKDRFDFAIVIDDLEVENWGRAGDVVAHFRSAAQHVLSGDTARNAQLLREKCSFHLLHPMLEALFFADPAALTVAGAPVAASVLRAPGDPEQFTATDPTYLDAPEEPKKSRKKGVRRWAVADRAHKPKHYLIYLSEQPGGTPYHETGDKNGGALALQGLAWPQVFGQAAECCFARSLFEDVASMLDRPNPYPGSCAPETWSAKPSTLRNL
jgi:phenylpyruvate tautomerase PptA (4-oxalocrotonate tautomerase family)